MKVVTFSPKAPNKADVSPKDILESILAEIKADKINPKNLIISMYSEDDAGEVCYFDLVESSMTYTETLGILTRCVADLTNNKYNA